MIMQTRTAPNDGIIRQGRWSSSPLFDRCLKANLVALRASVLKSAEQREMIWFLQALSLAPGGLRWAAQEIAPHCVHELDRERWAIGLCLDPETDLELQVAMPKLEKLHREYVKAKAAGTVVTELGQKLGDALDYCQQSHCLVLISGLARTGKTFAASRWVEQHPGRARYVQTPSAGDDLAWHTAIARAIGITVESDPKTKKLRPRIETALQGGDIMLVLDCAEYIFPSHNYRLARPSRVSWIMTELTNKGVAVAMLATPQFLETQADYAKKTGWAIEQWLGRIERFVPLPETLSMQDLERVAASYLPDGNRRSIEALADYANLSKKYLAAIEHSVKQARYMARQDGREQATWPDIQRALKESVMPGDSALVAAVEAATARRRCRAMSPRRDRDRFAGVAGN